MSNLEKIDKSLQEIREMIVLIGESEEQVLIQKDPDGERKRLNYFLFALLVSVGIAVFTTYNHFAITAQTEILNKFSEEKLLRIKQEIIPAMEKEALGTLPEVQNKLELRLIGRLESLEKRNDSHIIFPADGPEKLPVQKSATPTKDTILIVRRTEGGNIQQGWP